MTNILILHGTDDTPQSNWFMWLKGKLVGRGYKVWLPQLPGADQPDGAAYTKFLLANKDFEFNDETIIIGHSSGAVEILNLLPHLPEGTRIKAAILVAAFKDDLGWDALQSLIPEPFNFEQIKAHCGKFLFIHSEDDLYCSMDHPKYLAEQTGGELVVFHDQAHFSTPTAPQYTKFPELIQFIDEAVADK